MQSNGLEEGEDLEKEIKEAGYISLESFTAYKSDVTDGLLRFGGLFEQALARALYHADIQDAKKILRYWNQKCEMHAHLERMFKAKERAQTE